MGILRSFDWLIVSRSQVGILCCGRFPAVAKNHWTGEHALLCAWLKWISNGLIYVQALGPLPFMMFWVKMKPSGNGLYWVYCFPDWKCVLSVSVSAGTGTTTTRPANRSNMSCCERNSMYGIELWCFKIIKTLLCLREVSAIQVFESRCSTERFDVFSPAVARFQCSQTDPVVLRPIHNLSWVLDITVTR